MTKLPLLGTGFTGLVGSKFMQMFAAEYEFANIDLANGIDITDQSKVLEFVSQSASPVIIHFAAFTDVTKAHQEKGDKNGIVYKVNVLGTRNIVEAAKQTGKKLIHISTAYVFDGEKEGLYTEEDKVNPIEWYGQTKAMAEEEVTSANIPYTIFRIDQPYRQDEFPKLDILHRIKKGLEAGTLPPMFTDHTFTATQIEQFSEYLKSAITEPLNGIFHATTDAVTTDYEFAQKVKEQFGLPGEVREGSLAEYLKTTDRPYQKNTSLDTTKLNNALNK